MSDARAAAMGKIQAVIDGHAFTIENPDLLSEDVQLDEAASVTSNKDLIEAQRLEQARLKTEADIQRLEEAKRKATSAAVKDELDTEIKNIKAEKLRAKQEEEAQREQDKQLPPGVGPAIRQGSNLVSGAIQGVDDATTRVMDTGKEVWGDLARVSTPGTIFLPVTVLLVLWLLLLPVNGHTRIEWLWLALTGNAHITGEPSGPATPIPGGAGGDFGTPVQTQAQNTAPIQNAVPPTPGTIQPIQGAQPGFTGPSTENV